MSAGLLVDAAGAPLTPCIIWSDQRAAGLVAALAPDADDHYRITGNPPGATYTAAKLAWLRQRSPEAFSRAQAFLQPKDWLVAQLTGTLATDPSDASCTNLFDLRQGRWDDSLFELYGLPTRIAPPILASHEIAGRVTASAAARLGIQQGTPVIMGGGDGPVTAIGTGIATAGMGYAALGTSAWVSFATAEPSTAPSARLATFAHVVPGLYVETGSMQSAGASIEWAGKLLGCSAGEVVAEALALPIPRTGAPFFLPYLQGERTPYWSALPAGTLFGLNPEHGRGALCAAVLEGVLIQLRVIVDHFAALGQSADPLLIAGGFGSAAGFEQRLATLLGRPIATLADARNSTARGAAILAAVGLGVLPDFSAASGWTRRNQPLAPETSPDGEQRYAVFRASWADAQRLAERAIAAGPTASQPSR